MNYELSNLTIGYGKKVIAKGINATLKSGKLTCLVGRNGTGKSTLLRTLAGFQPALSGAVSIGGKSMSALDKQQYAQMVSVVLTARPDLQQMNVREVVALGRSPYTDMWGRMSDEDRAVVDESIKLAGVECLAERNIETLSDGECQKVMIAKALAQQTPVILLDEPTAFLDYPSKYETMQLMKDIVSRSSESETQRSVLLSTHDMEMALRLADELWVMTSEHKLVTGAPAELTDLLVNEKLANTMH